MKDTKVIDFDILYHFNKFKFYCYLSGTTSIYLLDHVRKLVRSGDILSKKNRESLIKIYATYNYEKPFLKDLLLEQLNILLDLIAFDNINSRYILNCLNYKAKKTRLAKKIESMLKDKVYQHKYFLTISFNNHYLKRKRTTLHQYIKEFLWNLDNRNTRYICNVDKGSKNHRLHYHAILCTNLEENEVFKNYIYGQRNDVKEICISDESIQRLSYYINKLVNHTYKDGTLEENVIFSRKRRKN